MLQLIKPPLPLLPLTVEARETFTELEVSVRLGVRLVELQSEKIRMCL